MGTSGGGGGGYARQLEEERQRNIKTGMQTINEKFAGFTPEFYKGRETAYQDYVMPQFFDQYRNTRDAVAFQQANRGQFGSSVGQRQNTSFNKEFAKQARTVAEQGRGEAQNLEKNVEANRASVVAQLQASADPTTAGQQAASAASMWQAPSVYAPLNNMFSQWANMYMANQYNKTADAATQSAQNIGTYNQLPSQKVATYVK